jgi:hypothetical protein
MDEKGQERSMRTPGIHLKDPPYQSPHETTRISQDYLTSYKKEKEINKKQKKKLTKHFGHKPGHERKNKEKNWPGRQELRGTLDT